MFHGKIKNPLVFILNNFFKNKSKKLDENSFSYSFSSCLFQLFPNEIILNIAKFLDCQSLCRLAQTCRRLVFLLEEESLWKHLYEKSWNTLKSKEKLYFNKWRFTFQKRYVLQKNWEGGRCQSTLMKPQHTLAIRDIQLCGPLAVTGSGDKSVKLWNLESFQNVASFSGSAGIGGLWFTEKFLVAG